MGYVRMTSVEHRLRRRTEVDRQADGHTCRATVTQYRVKFTPMCDFRCTCVLFTLQILSGSDKDFEKFASGKMASHFLR